jgi:hypothetical protein
MEKQTAVEWLISEWLKLDSDYYIGNIGRFEYREKRNQKHNEAKEIEKQQIIEAHGSKLKNSRGTSNFEYWYTGEEYYKKTFENK